MGQDVASVPDAVVDPMMPEDFRFDVAEAVVDPLPPEAFVFDSYGSPGRPLASRLLRFLRSA